MSNTIGHSKGSGPINTTSVNVNQQRGSAVKPETSRKDDCSGKK